ncbi:restriction endonuclease subunit S [Desulfovibrio piger]|nr:restriction endonuclease subunit S [Desulfovibrio piger]
MKDSGIEWIGEIPEGWEVRKLKYLTLCNANSLSETTSKDTIIKYIDISSISEEKGIFTEQVYNFASAPSRARRVVHTNDTIISTVRTYLKAVAYIDSRHNNYICSTGFAVLSALSDISSKFIYYIVYSDNFIKNTEKLSTGISYPAITANQLHNIKVPFPPLTEQQRIADYLDAKCAHIDQCLELTRQSMEKLRAYKLSCITEAVTKGLDPDVPLKDSGVPWIGQIPAGWENKRLRYLGTCQNGISKAGEFFGHGKPFISYKDVYLNITLPQNTNSLIDSTESERNLYSVKEGDIFFTRTSETIEEIGFASTCINTIENACFAGFLIRFRPHRGILNKHFGKYYFRNSALRSYFSQMNIVTRASLSQEILKNLPVLLPPLPEQERIAAYLDKKCARIDALLEEKQALLDKLAEYKKSLIFEYVTGKREVPSCWNR